MHHEHFKEISSTQLYLKENIKELLELSKDILISTDVQTAGMGRGENQWVTFPNTLAFSFTLKPTDPISLTPLEVGVALLQFFKICSYKNLSLKWPNDIIVNDGQKCGGILCHYYSDDTLLVGVGINLGKLEDGANEKIESILPIGTIDPNLTLDEQSRQMWIKRVYEFLLTQRFKSNEIVELWADHCAHIGKDVTIFDVNSEEKGTFVGIGTQGEAIIINSDTGQEKIFFSGNLKY